MRKICRKKMIKRKSAGILAICMVISLTWPHTAYAAGNTPKEEVVYVNLNEDGSVKEVYIVNSFKLEEAGQIVDYGKYQDLRNMTTTDKIEYADDTVTISAGSGKLYYEGKLDSSVIPWNISIHYYMNGKEYSSDEIAGMDGKLKITVSITQNTKCKGSFFDDYALQVSLALDTDQCSHIDAPDATIANVGNNKQLTYTILPGKGAEIEITADATGFEMDGIAINGIPLNLNIEVDDAELMDQITELIDAIEQLDDGASELKDGVSELQRGAQGDLHDGISALSEGAGKLHSGAGELRDGGSTLQNGAAELQSGAASLDGGIRSLNDGIVQIQDALNTLHMQSGTLTNGSAEFKSALVQLQSALSGISVTSEDLSALTSASEAIKGGISGLVSGVEAMQQNVNFASYKAAMHENGLDIDSLKQNNEEAVRNLGSLLEGIQKQIGEMQANGIDTAALEGQAGQLQNMIQLLYANNASISGTESYLAAVSQNLSVLSEGAAALRDNYIAFDAKITELANLLGNLSYQMGELSSAVNTLAAEYGKLDDGIIAYTDGVAQIVAGYSQVADGASQLVSGSSTLKTGSDNLYNGTSELFSGIAELYDATGTLKDGTGELDDGVAELLAGIVSLYDGTGELKDGTHTLRNETDGMDTEISDKINELMESISGGNVELRSFVSEKNMNVESVQFAIQTGKIQMEESAETILQEPEKLNFWQKLLHLFKM